MKGRVQNEEEVARRLRKKEECDVPLDSFIYKGTILGQS